MEQRYAAGIVLYNPDIDRLKLNIESVIGQVGIVYLFDNGSINQDEINALNSKYNNTKIIRSSKNLGIATALNRLVEVADKDGFTWILTLDQDSVSVSGMISSFARYISKKNAGIICPVFHDIRRKNEAPVMIEDRVKEINFCITSGSLMNIKICKKIGGFDDWLFIGFVDNEYCKRLILKGYKIIQDCSVILDHELGNLSPSKYENVYLKVGKIFHSDSIKKMSYKRDVNPMRLYYATRNMVYLNKKYKNYLTNDISWKFIIYNSVSSIFRGNKKIKLLSVIIKGIRDGLHAKPEVYILYK